MWGGLGWLREFPWDHRKGTSREGDRFRDTKCDRGRKTERGTEGQGVRKRGPGETDRQGEAEGRGGGWT